MVKAAFVGFGEVNTPAEIILKKCTDAEAALKAEGLDLISVYPVTDDYEEKDIKKAVEEKQNEIEAYVVTKGMKKFTLRLGDLTDDEREIITKGCLINYYRD